MKLRWSKFQWLDPNGNFKLSAPDGSVVEPAGACICSDGFVKSELGRRLAVVGRISESIRVFGST